MNHSTVNRERGLRIRVRESEWLLIPDLQGRKTDLMVGITLHEGRLAALAQWTSRVGGPEVETVSRFCLVREPESVARVLTMARIAVGSGEA